MLQDLSYIVEEWGAACARDRRGDENGRQLLPLLKQSGLEGIDVFCRGTLILLVDLGEDY